ncbi:MAG: single-stranded DNA-binding protein [Candidatus Dormibacteraeota bacterium]|nr:single-stranded DNA-binding protein [Candidatus Dormibacteraeota bacterium]
MSLNKVMLIGRLTRDPEMRYTPSGQPVTSFGLATNRYASGADGDRREFTDFHNIVCWNIGRRNLAEIVAQYTRKGAQVYVEGRLSTRSWEGQDGQKRSRTEVVANDVQFLDTRGGGQGDGGYGQDGGYAAGSDRGGAQSYPEPSVQDVDPDDIPF